MHDLSRRTAVRFVLAAAATLSVSLTSAAETAPLAMKGYDPVAYFTEKRATPGSARYQHEWDGATYQFASAQHLDFFKADPDRYLPQYNSLCVASVAKGIKYEGDPEHWLVVDDRLYLFGAAAGVTAMKANAAAMTRKAEENWAKVSQTHPRM